MTMTDPIADMLTRIRNANIAMHDVTVMPSSKVKEALAKILLQEGYIEGWDAADDPTRPGRKLTITLKYTPDRRRTIAGIRRVSKPGLRVYTAADRGSARARRHGHRGAVHQPGSPHRSPGARAPGGRRDPLSGLVAKPCPESARSPSPSRVAST